MGDAVFDCQTKQKAIEEAEDATFLADLLQNGW